LRDSAEDLPPAAPGLLNAASNFLFTALEESHRDEVSRTNIGMESGTSSDSISTQENQEEYDFPETKQIRNINQMSKDTG
jgi:hypothetical protein